jgi:VWFA-related protein
MSAVVLVAVATFTGASARLGAETLLQQLGGAPQSANGALPDPSSRMVVLLFDLGGLSADDTRRAVDASAKFVESAAPSDRVAIVTMSTKLRVVTDFTADHAVLTALLQSPELLQPAAGGLIEQPDADTRLRAITTVCQTIAPIQERKAMLYFGGAAVGRDAVDQAELNNATNACRRGNVQIYPVDARGLAPLATAPQR